MRIMTLAACLALTLSAPAHAADNTGTTPTGPAATPATTNPAGPTMNPATAMPSDTPADASNDTTGEQVNTPDNGPLTATDKIVNRFMELDTDGNEGVSFEEYMAMVQQRAQDRFNSMDANQDGEVSAEEYRDFWKARRAQYYRPKR